MNVFIGGSIRISRLNNIIRDRLNNIIIQGLQIYIGDANGVDKAVQKYLNEKNYKKVTVFCSGNSCRNNIGNWKTEYITVSNKLKGRNFYMVKDKIMAEKAQYGFMVWDGKSAGTLNNALNLLKDQKKVVLYFAPEQHCHTISNIIELNLFLEKCDKKNLELIERKIHFKKMIPKYNLPNQLQLPL